MTRRVWAVVAVVGFALVTAGLVIGLAGITRYGTACGSVLGGLDKSATSQADITRAVNGDTTGISISDLSAVTGACQQAISDRGPFTWGLIAPGALLVAVGATAAGIVTIRHEEEGTTV